MYFKKLVKFKKKSYEMIDSPGFPPSAEKFSDEFPRIFTDPPKFSAPPRSWILGDGGLGVPWGPGNERTIPGGAVLSRCVRSCVRGHSAVYPLSLANKAFECVTSTCVCTSDGRTHCLPFGCPVGGDHRFWWWVFALIGFWYIFLMKLLYSNGKDLIGSLRNLMGNHFIV